MRASGNDTDPRRAPLAQREGERLIDATFLGDYADGAGPAIGVSADIAAVYTDLS